MKSAETIDIVLSSGDIATIEMSSNLLEQIKLAFGLNADQTPTASQVKYFLAKSMQNALEKM
jgi:hypothetical protein